MRNRPCAWLSFVAPATSIRSLDGRALAKLTLLRAGARASERALHLINGVFDYVELGWWLNDHGFRGDHRRASCSEIPPLVSAALDDRPVVYLQFGADDADLARCWAKALAHAGAQLALFAPPTAGDRWLPARGRGHTWGGQQSSTARSRAALAADDRVRVLADAPLPELLASYVWDHDLPLVAVFDTDYYPTTKLALDFVRDRLPEEAFLFFDQLNHRADELRAFHEFLMETDARFELFAANPELSCAVFRRIA